MQPYVPDFSADLIDEGYIDISRAGGNSFYQAAMPVFKYAFRRPQNHLKTILTTAYGAAADERYRDFLNALLRYIIILLKDEHAEEVRKAVRAVNMREVEEAYMTIADKLDAALDEIVVAESKEQVLNQLK